MSTLPKHHDLLHSEDAPGSDSAYDALAELFLGDSRASRPTPVAKLSVTPAPHPAEPLRAAYYSAAVSPAAKPIPARAVVEALVLGHLPVMASPWAAQHAAAAADRSEEPVALLRITAGFASLELFGAGASPVSTTAPTLAAAFDAAARVARRWVIRVDAVDELALVAHDRVDVVTLLTSSDEAAIVSAYRTLKSLTTPVASREPALAGGVTPGLHVSIVGADATRSARAGARLKQAAEAFLGHPLEIAPPTERIGPLRSAKLFRGPAAGDSIEEILSLLADAISAAAGRSPSNSSVSAPPAGTSNPTAKDLPTFTDPQPTSGEQPFGSMPRGVQSAPADNSAVSAKDVLLRAAPVSLSGTGAALSSHVPGLSAIQARCPYDESIELAVDAEGALHVLALATEKSVESLAVVADWAALHARLLALTSPEARRLEAARPPRQHLFTDRPAAIRRLLDTHVQVHLLSPVKVEDKTGWCCVELN